jgi:serine/threonine protein kinase
MPPTRKKQESRKKRKDFRFPCFAIVLEYVGGGELFDFIALGGRFSPSVARTYFQQMMNGLHYMHQQGYAHRDIKPENILLTTEYLLKLADFGFTGAL